MKKPTLVLLLAAVAASVGLTWFLHRRTQTTIAANRAALHQQEQQLESLSAERTRLSNQLQQATQSTNRYLGEMADLRRVAEALLGQSNALAQRVDGRRAAPTPKPPARSEPRPPEYYEQLHRVAGTRPKDTLLLTQAVLEHAWSHQNQLPAALDAVIARMPQGAAAFSGTNRIDLVYRGSLDDLKGVPGGSIAILRDQRVWIAPSGKKARVYGMSNGSSQIVESDDDFKSWEAGHIVK